MVFSVDAVHVGAGQSLVVQAPNHKAVKLEVGTLEVTSGGRVELNAPVELHAERAVFGEGSSCGLVGADGGPGHPGSPGSPGAEDGPWGTPGGNGTPGSAGGRGGGGGGGGVFFEGLRRGVPGGG